MILYCCCFLLGGLSIAVPGEVMGYWEAHQMFGKLPWADLFEPSIELAEQGFIVGPALAYAIDDKSDLIMNDPNLRQVLETSYFSRDLFLRNFF